MKYLKNLIQQTNEEAAAGSTSAAAVAAVPSAVGSKEAEEQGKKKKRKGIAAKVKTVMQRRAMNEQEEFNSADVLSKLKTAELASDVEDTVTFGLEDDAGNIIKVKINAEQADAFEEALNSIMSDGDDDTEVGNQVPEIAEVLFNLKDRFDIVDVQWHDIQGDEEEEIVDGEDTMDGEGDDTEGEMTADDGMTDELAGGDEASAQTALQQVIAMMTADAEAKKAEAEAKKAEAKAREAELNRQSAEHKVKQEEMYLDMEDYEKSKKDQEQETKRLARLAKYKHDLKKDGSSIPDDEISTDDQTASADQDGGFEDEEETISPRVLAKTLRYLLQKQQ